MRRLVICLALVTGCRSWEVNGFDVPLTPKEPRLLAASDTGEVPVWVLVALAVVDVAIGVLYYQERQR